MIQKETLQKKLQELIAQKEQTNANLNAQLGAISILEQLIKECDEEKKEESVGNGN